MAHGGVFLDERILLHDRHGFRYHDVAWQQCR
jgi:hypothetical protein